MRRSIAGAVAIRAAIEAGDPVALLLLPRDAPDDALVGLARAKGIPVWLGGPGDLRRMSRSDLPDAALAMLGASPQATLSELMGRPGPVWLLADGAYPSNVGFAIRTAEVSGAAGLVIDGAFGREERRRAEHVSMGAHRLLPVLWGSATEAIAAARAAGRRIVALEDAGGERPEDVALRGEVLLLFGGEHAGLPAALLECADARVRLPMRGFVPSYNVQAAMAMVAAECLRQEGAAAAVAIGSRPLRIED